MYDIELIQGLFKEAEIICMEEEFVNALNQCMDVSVASNILSFLDKADLLEKERGNSENVVLDRILKTRDLIRSICEDKAKRYTFHTLIPESIRMFLSSTSVRTILIVDVDLVEVKKYAKMIIENKNNLIMNIPARTFDSLNNLENAVISLDINKKRIFSKISEEVPFNQCTNLIKRFSANKTYFFSPGEKEIPTGLSRIITNMNSLEEIIHGIEFTIMCEREGISTYWRRRIVL